MLSLGLVPAIAVMVAAFRRPSRFWIISAGVLAVGWIAMIVVIIMGTKPSADASSSMSGLASAYYFIFFFGSVAWCIVSAEHWLRINPRTAP